MTSSIVCGFDGERRGDVSTARKKKKDSNDQALITIPGLLAPYESPMRQTMALSSGAVSIGRVKVRFPARSEKPSANGCS